MSGAGAVEEGSRWCLWLVLVSGGPKRYGHVGATDGRRREIAAAHGRRASLICVSRTARPGRARPERGGATQRAYDLTERHALLFRSRRRAAGIPRLATLTPHAAITDFSPSSFFECASVTAGT